MLFPVVRILAAGLQRPTKQTMNNKQHGPETWRPLFILGVISTAIVTAAVYWLATL